jgi:hypothetical protein
MTMQDTSMQRDNVIALPVRSLEDTQRAINTKFAEAFAANKKMHLARVAVGQMLIELRARIEAGEAGDWSQGQHDNRNWWKWYRYGSRIVRSRQDAEKVMKLAHAEDPESAAEDEREKNRKAVRKHRAKLPLTVSGDSELQDDLVQQALALCAQMTLKQRLGFSEKFNELYGGK